jgi:hypothetical protein
MNAIITAKIAAPRHPSLRVSTGIAGHASSRQAFSAWEPAS